MKPLLPLVLVSAVVPCFAQEPCEPVRIEPPAVVRPTNFGGAAVDGGFWFISDSNARTFCGGDPFHCAGGAVHVYTLVDGGLVFQQMLQPTGPQLHEHFGSQMVVDGGRLLATAPSRRWPDLEANGGAFIFEHDGERWVQTATLRPPEHISRAFTDGLGGSAAIEGDSAYLRPSNREFVFSYVNRDGQWHFHEMIECPDALPREAGFGVGIEALEHWVFISAYKDPSLVALADPSTPIGDSPTARWRSCKRSCPPMPPAGRSWRSVLAVRCPSMVKRWRLV